MSASEGTLIDSVRRLSRALPQWVTVRLGLLALELRLNVNRVFLILALGALTGCLLFSVWACACALAVMALVTAGAPWYAAVLGLLVASAGLALISGTVAAGLVSRIRFSSPTIPPEPGS